MTERHLPTQLRRFIVTGLTATVVDSSVYALMLYLGMDFSPAKACGFMAALSVAYNGHRRWTFSTRGSRRRMAAFAGLYIMTFIINNLTNTLMLEILGKEQKTGIAGAFIVATGLTALVNFTVLKFFIFRPEKTGRPPP